ncbi:alpha/beta hydrolase [Arachidicoccus sp.]|uniref:alpha/beta hydrolase n=1 Tax=Arachidicoccus sp. TaxID=1872624 RepID=UPI003D25F693
MKIESLSVIVLLLFLSLHVRAQREIPLYNGHIPNSKKDTVSEKMGTWGNDNYYLTNIKNPTLTIYLPKPNNATGTAIVICPGGGYGAVAINHEGYQIAEAFQKMGVAAFVLKYRLPSDLSMINKSIGPLQDAQRAIQLVKENAKEWHIDTARVGIAGFSAGGHLAACIGTHFQHNYIVNKNGISFRPTFMVLGYPVISFTDSLTHRGSRDNLIGKNPSEKLIREFSNELQVTSNTPPAFIFQAENDATVEVENSIIFFQALHKHGVNAELLIYPKGSHGFGLNNPTTSSKWINECQKWMMSNGWLKKNADNNN